MTTWLPGLPHDRSRDAEIEEERMRRLHDHANLLGLPAKAVPLALQMAQQGHEAIEHPTPQADITAALSHLDAIAACMVKPGR